MSNPYEKVFIRSSEEDLGEFTKDLYKILQLCESPKSQTLSNVRITNRAFTSPIKNKVDLIYDVKNNSYFKKKNPKLWILDTTIDLENVENKIYFTHSGSIFLSFLKHLRNSYAHNQIVIKGNYIMLGDFIPKQGSPDFNSPTMLGRISTKDFKTLLSAIKAVTSSK